MVSEKGSTWIERWLTAPTHERPSWAWTVSIALAVGVAAIPFTDLEVRPAPDSSTWSDPLVQVYGDFGLFVNAGHHLMMGQFGEVFSDPTVQTGPLALAWAAVLAFFLHVVGAPGGIGTVLSVAAGLAPSLYCVTLWSSRHTPPRWLYLAACCGLLVALGAWDVASALAFQHVTYLWVPALWLAAGNSARKAEVWPTTLWLVLACGLETWGALAVPVVLATLPSARGRVQALVLTGLGTACVWAPFVLSGDFRMLEMKWGNDYPSIVTMLLGGPEQVTWKIRIGQGIVITGASLVAWAVAHRARSNSSAIAIMVVVWSRLLIDNQLWPYYRLSLYIATAAITLAAASCFLRFRDHRTVPAVVLSLFMLFLASIEFPPKPTGMVFVVNSVLLLVLVLMSSRIRDATTASGPMRAGPASYKPDHAQKLPGTADYSDCDSPSLEVDEAPRVLA